MLNITVGTESYDEEKEEFVLLDPFDLEMEHSLVSLSKWESEFKKPFLDREHSGEELLRYIQIMTLTPDVPPEVWNKLSKENINAIYEYMTSNQTATWFSDQGNVPRTNEVVTSELIYYWMTVFQIPFSCENWHISRLFTLILVCNNKQSKPKTMSRTERAQRQAELNRQRREQYKTKG